MIKAIVIDDQSSARESLTRICSLKFKNKIEVLDAVGSVKDGVSSIRKNQPDLIFLDVEMPGENGFKLFDYFDNFNFDVVFVTAFEKYAIRAINCAAFAYILKPINEESLAEIIAKYEGKQFMKASTDRLKLLMENYSLGNLFPPKIALPTLTGYRILNVNEILYCLAEDNYTQIITYNKENILVSKTLKLIEEMLPDESFFRIHKSTLINLNYIRTLNLRNDCSLTLENGETFEIAHRRRGDLELLIKKKYSAKV